MHNLRRPLIATARQTLKRTSPTSHTPSVIRQHIQRAAYASRTGPSAGPPLTNPLNIPKWYRLDGGQLKLGPFSANILIRLESNSHLLKPPVNNYLIYNDPMTVMVVGGPNARTDYHINQTPEFFYQYKGRMLLKTVDEGKFRDVYINEGELFLLPAGVPHNPVRFANSVGIVIEQPRPEGSMDTMRWYCQSCGERVYEESFHCTDLGTQIKDAVKKFTEDEEARRCGNCDSICDVTPSKEAMERMQNAPS